MKFTRGTMLMLATVAILLATAGVLIWREIAASNPLSPVVSGTVKSVVDKPNQSEDGYYGINIEDASGHPYAINATGFLNNPPHIGRTIQCLDVPRVDAGQQVEFRLPKDTNTGVDYTTCYDQNHHYYFKVK